MPDDISQTANSAPAETGGVGLHANETPVAPVPPAAESPSVEVPATPESKLTETKLDALLGEQPEVKESPETKSEVNTEKPEGEPKDEASQSEPAPLPTYEITLPEGFTPDDEVLGKYTNLLGEFENGPKDRESFNKLAQELVDLNVSALQKSSERAHEALMANFEKQKTEWRDLTKNDPEIGKNRFDTTIANASRAIKLYAGTKEQQAEFRQLVENTGVENHPAMIRFLNGVVQARTPKSLPGTKPVPSAKQKISQIMYGKSK